MPCFSTIRTKMNNADHLAAALKALGYTVNMSGSSIGAYREGERAVTFSRGYDGAFSASGNTGNLAAIGRKYAETGVRAWAQKNRFSVMENDGVSMTLGRRSF